MSENTDKMAQELKEKQEKRRKLLLSAHCMKINCVRQEKAMKDKGDESLEALFKDGSDFFEDFKKFLVELPI